MIRHDLLLTAVADRSRQSQNCAKLRIRQGSFRFRTDSVHITRAAVPLGGGKRGFLVFTAGGGADFEGIEFVCVFWGVGGRPGQWWPTAERRGRPHEQGRRATRFAPMAGGAHGGSGRAQRSVAPPARAAHPAAAAGLWVAETSLDPGRPWPLQFAVDSAIGPRRPAGRLHQESGSDQASFLRLT